MAEQAPGRVALFSIKPGYAEAILDGTKQVEFRRRGLSKDATHVVIYATAPVKRVVGFFSVAGVDEATPSGLWNRYRKVGGIDRPAYNAYFAGRDAAFAIRVSTPTRLPRPLPLSDLNPRLRPPQSFQYLDTVLTAKVFASGEKPSTVAAILGCSPEDESSSSQRRALFRAAQRVADTAAGAVRTAVATVTA